LVNPVVEEKGSLKEEKYREAVSLANTMANRLDEIFG
jgi:hypothetical protein